MIPVNLIKECAVHKVTNVSICRTLKISERAVYNKMNGLSDFTVPEAIKIRDVFFPDMSIEYLFEQTNE